MKNVHIHLEKNFMIIKVDLDSQRWPSKSGETMMVASSQGNEPVVYGDEKVYVGVNVYAKPS